MVDQEIIIIHKNILNGNKRDAINLIEKYGSYFFLEYARYLNEAYANEDAEHYYFKDAVLSYFQIKGM